MKTILIIGGDNGGGSAGDEIMCEAACDFFIKSGFYVVTDAQTESWKSPVPNVNVVKQIRKDDYKNLITRFLKSILKMYRIFLLPLVIRKKYNIPLLLHGNKFKNTMQHVDVVLFAGCGGITDKYLVNVLAWWSIIRSAQRLNVPVYMSGIGVGPLNNKILRFFVRRFIHIPKYITLRDSVMSEHIVNELGRCKNLIVVPDDAYFYEVGGETKKQVEELLLTLDTSKKNIGINVMSRIFSNEAKIDLFVTMLREVFPNDFFNLIFVAVTQEDVHILLKIQHKLKYGCVVDKKSPSYIKSLIGKMYLMISARYHGCVFGVCGNVPTIGLYGEEYWKNKIIGALSFTGSEDYAYPINTLSLYPVVSKIFDNYDDIKNKIRDLNENLKQSAFFIHHLIVKEV